MTSIATIASLWRSREETQEVEKEGSLEKTDSVVAEDVEAVAEDGDDEDRELLRPKELLLLRDDKQEVGLGCWKGFMSREDKWLYPNSQMTKDPFLVPAITLETSS